MISRTLLRALGCLSFSVAGAPHIVVGQALDRTLSSMVGGVIGGFGGIVVSLPQGCGGVFSDRICDLHTVAKGFGVGNVLGSALGAARSGGASSCSPAERFGRSLVGTLAGGGISVAAVSQ